MCEVNLTVPMQTARVNRTKITRAECISLLNDEGYQIEESSVIPDAIRALKGNLASSKAFKDGLLTIQDESSMLAAYALGAKENENVLDACAAPGGKTTHIAECMGIQGKLFLLIFMNTKLN